ncbi:MAG: arsenate reductase ArsC [Ferruginibacter sp.]
MENSNRSQMAQAFAKMLAGNKVEAYSAGSKPSGIINPKAIAAMKELQYDLSVHDSKSLDNVEAYAPFDAVVTMGCGDACPWMPAKQFIDWQIPDPRNMEPAEFNQVRDLIKQKVEMSTFHPLIKLYNFSASLQSWITADFFEFIFLILFQLS